MKKYYIVLKSIIQIFLYLLEVIGVSFLITIIFNKFFPIESTSQFIDKMILFYTVYQILVLVILTNLNDISKDSYLAYLTILKLCLIYSNSKDSNLKNHIIYKIDEQLNPQIFNIISIYNSYKSLKINIDTLSSSDIELEIIKTEHIYQSLSLNWRYSFILRLKIFK